MLCPEIYNFPPPKVVSACKTYDNAEAASETIKMNDFYKSLIVCCPDELQTPPSIEELITDDNDYYKVSNCAVTEFIDCNFIENFVKKGKLYCLTLGTNCIVQNCVAITSDGYLTLHVLDFIYQTLGLEGTKRPHNFYEIKLDLKNLKNIDKLNRCLSKLEEFDFMVCWEPNNEDVCPSSIAKYFYDRDIAVSVCTPQIKHLTPSITEVPGLDDDCMDEMAEWIGMLAHGGDLYPTESYISTYNQPDSENSQKTSRICLLIAKGLFTPTVIEKLCRNIQEYALSRQLEGYWASLSVQSYENSLWQWKCSSPRMFQAHDSTCNLFFNHSSVKEYSIGQIKYS